MRHVNIPIFIPHLGCPNQCVFCNQRTISGVVDFDISKVRTTIEDTLLTLSGDECVEIAFFGGSFTGIDRSLMIDLLSIAHKYVESGEVESIRCSTRPDYINAEILDVLFAYGVKHIELGLQSSSERVLEISKRGHGCAVEKEACRLVRERGFGLTGQMMIGLPGSTLETELETARFIIEAGCDSARIYPTVVFKNTELCQMAENGFYEPLTVDDAVARSAAVLKLFRESNINVLRIGLCSSENLVSDNTYFAGPNHPALGELVENELFYNVIFTEASVLGMSDVQVLHVYVARGSLSKAVGQRKRNKLRLKSALGITDVRFSELDTLSGYEISLSVE